MTVVSGQGSGARKKSHKMLPCEWSGEEEGSIAGVLANLNVIQIALDSAWKDLRALQRKSVAAAKKGAKPVQK